MGHTVKESHLSQTLKAIDEYIRQGGELLARRELKKIIMGRIPRAELAHVASLSWRANLPDAGVRILNPVVRATRKIPMLANDQEKAQYAACLIKIGASHEGLEILKTLDPTRVPEILLFRTFALVGQWEYAATIPILKRYIILESVPPYQKLVGRVNLAAAHVYAGEFESASSLLEEVAEEAKSKSLKLILAKTLELSAQNEMNQGHWDRTLAFVKEAENNYSRSKSLDEFFLKKWLSIVSFLRSTPTPAATLRIEEIQKEAGQRGHWETIRDCDRYRAIHEKNEQLLLHIYFGTPYASFRKNLIGEFETPVEIPAFYRWHLNGNKEARHIDLSTGETSSGKSLKVGQLLHRTLYSLAKDFYRPVRFAHLHELLYPGQHFNPTSAPFRIHNGMHRLRHWLSKHHIPLAIEERAGFYRLGATQPMVIIVPSPESPPDRKLLHLQKLQDEWRHEPFSLSEASKSLAIPPRSAFRILLDGYQRKQLVRIGNGRATRYRFQ